VLRSWGSWLLGACAVCWPGCDGGEVGVYERADAAVADEPTDAAFDAPSTPDEVPPIADPPSEPVPVVIDRTGPDNPAHLSPAEVADLMAGGPSDGMVWLYPYDGTVFPRGMLAPLVMWNGDATVDAVYLRIKSRAFEYRGVLPPTIKSALSLPFGLIGSVASGAISAITGAQGTQLPIPQYVWDLAGEQTLGAGDVFTLELTERRGGQIRGPLVSHIRIARAELKVSIYYNSCLSALQGETALEWLMDPLVSASSIVSIASGSKVFRIPARGNAELVLSQPGQFDARCQGCHSVSADGSRLVALQSLLAESGASLLTGVPVESSQSVAYPLGWASDFTAGSGISFSASAYGALYPDGSKYLSSSGIADVGLFALFGGPSVLQSLASTLYDAASGVAVPGTQIPEGAAMPMFARDGKRLVFNDFTRGDGRTLAIMDYDTKLHRASGYRVLLEEDAAGVTRPGWPSFLPDGEAVVFVRTDSPGFSSSGAGVVALSSPLSDLVLAPAASSDLYLTGVSGASKLLLARAMGFDTLDDSERGSTYLPFGADDLHRNYFPSVAPIAAGGYFSVFFDSLRHYGNLGKQRALWAFALEIASDGRYAIDPSHPPFYLPGQEFGSTNHHAVAALDKCRPDAARCTAGVECCSGRCRAGVCSAAGEDCARVDERCTRPEDCCTLSGAGERSLCIANVCASLPALE
jgi:hypothetical protein